MYFPFCLPYLKCVRDIILKNGFYFIKTKHVKLNQDQAAEFYKEHKGELASFEQARQSQKQLERPNYSTDVTDAMRFVLSNLPRNWKTWF